MTRPMDAAGTVDARNAPTAPCKPHRARFAQRPQALICVVTNTKRGQFYFAKGGDISISR